MLELTYMLGFTVFSWFYLIWCYVEICVKTKICSERTKKIRTNKKKRWENSKRNICNNFVQCWSFTANFVISWFSQAFVLISGDSIWNYSILLYYSISIKLFESILFTNSGTLKKMIKFSVQTIQLF